MSRLKTQVRFGLVPEWVFTHPDLSHGAVRLYTALALHSYKDGTSTPTRLELAEQCQMSLTQVKRCRAELVAVGAVQVESRKNGKENLPSAYTVIQVEGGRATGGPRGGASGAPRVGPRAAQSTSRVVQEQKKTLVVAPRAELDAMWDALLVVCDGTPETREEKSKRGKCVQSLLLAGGGPKDVPIRAGKYRRKYPGAVLTDTALVAHWGELNGRGPSERSHVCPVCGLGFGGERTLAEHLYVSHGKEVNDGTVVLASGT